MNVKINKMSNLAKTPQRSSVGSAGYDIYTIENCNVLAGKNKLIKTGIKIEMEDGVYAKICPRSGLAIKHSIGIGGGVIDSDYRGEICVIVFNHGDKDYEIRCGDRIAQIVFQRYLKVNFIEDEQLTKSVRGESGFGSTGI